jgi:hypothetical protein
MQAAAAYAKVQEYILLRQKLARPAVGRVPFQWAESCLNLDNSGDMWKARRLKEYRRTDGLCFSCREKVLPMHVDACKIHA